MNILVNAMSKSKEKAELKNHCFPHLAEDHSSDQSDRNSRNKCGTDTECRYIKRDYYPSGAKIINGSGRMISISSKGIDKTYEPLRCGNSPKYLAELAKGYCPPQFDCGICIKDCCEFKSAECINYIDGDLIIKCSGICEKGTGLPGLKKYDNRREVHDIFPNLIGVNGSIYIIGTDYGKITGFKNLEYVVGDIVIVNNENLVVHPTFPSLITVGRKTIDLFSQCDQSIVDFQPHIKGTGRIIIGNNPLLRKIIGFELLRQVSTGIYILENECLTQICGFINLFRTDDIVINSNKNLHKIIGFCYTDTVSELIIACNNHRGDSLFIVDAFHNLINTSNLIIYCNHHLKAICLSKLMNNKYSLVIDKNRELEIIKFGSLAFANIIAIRHNNSLNELEFPSLQAIDDGLFIENNDSIEKISTFDSLKRIGKSIHIIGNKRLISIKGFESVQYIGSYAYPLSDSKCDEKCTDCGCQGTYWDTLIDCFDSQSGNFSGLCYDISSESQTEYECYAENYQNCYDRTGEQILNYYPNICGVFLPSDIYNYLCGPDNKCRKNDIDSNSYNQTVLVTSVVIYNNNRLVDINAFNSVKNVESNIYIIKNRDLLTITAFSTLDFVTDIWIRNNPVLKKIFGFSELKGARVINVLETVCLDEFYSLDKLEHCEYILIEAKNSKSIKGIKGFKPSVNGTIIYYK